MSYDRDFYLTVNDNNVFHEIEEYLIDELQVSVYRYSDYELAVSEYWLDYEEGLSKLSKAFPNVVFTLKVYGEEREDISVVYAFNGATETFYAEVVFTETTFLPPKKEYRTVYVNLVGVDIPIEIECYVNTDEETAHNIARRILRGLI